MAPRCCIYLAHQWRIPKVMAGLLILELPLTIACLVLFGIADGDSYRKKLWQDGSNHGFNSNPNEILYDYANYRPVHYPLVWSSFLIQWNVVVSVFSMFVLLVKATMFIMGALLPILSVFVHILLIALYAVAVRNQAAPDLTNKKVPHLQKNVPWFLSKGCSYASKGNQGFCMQAQASFGVTIVMLVLFCAYLGVAIHSARITKDEKAERLAEWEEEKDLKQYEESYDPDEDWEARRQMFLNTPRTPATPWSGMPVTTPRTTAFNHLNGGAGEASAVGRYQSTQARPLAFRQQYGDGPVPDAR